MNVNRVWLAASIWKCLAGAYFLLSILSLLCDDVDFFLFDGALIRFCGLIVAF